MSAASLSSHRTDRIRSLVVVVAAVAQVVSGGFAGASTGAISDANQTPVTPATYAFSIWGLIYLASLVYAVHQLLPSQIARPAQRRSGWLLAAAFGCSAVWVPIFATRTLWLAQVVIVVLLALLTAAVLRLSSLPAAGTAERAFLRIPVTLYLGWALLATAAGFGTTFRSFGLPAEGGLVVAVSIVLVAVATALAVVVLRRGTALAGFAFTAGWALVAIALADAVPAVTVVAVAGLLVVIATLVWRTGRSRTKARVLLG